MSNYYNIDSMHGQGLSAGIQSEIVARRAAQAHANRLGESVYLYEVGSDDGAEEIRPELPEDAVIVETMPDQHRASHEAAGNWGSYPHNGAVRRVMSRSDAESVCDGDDYNHIIGDADADDARNYGVEVVS